MNLDNDTSSAFVVHPVTGESLRFPFITDEMAADDYFDADFDSDLGDTDSNTSLDHDLGAGEAYLANCGDSTLTDNDLIDEELTISRQKTISTQILTFITDVMAADDYFNADFDFHH